MTAMANPTTEPAWKRSGLWRILRRTRGAVRKRVRRTTTSIRAAVAPPRPRHAEPFTTHLPILAALAVHRPVRRVVEYGSGLISTPAFLDRTLFPDLEQIVSYENDAAWSHKVAEAIDDERLHLRTVRDAVADAVVAAETAAADLIFIDDSVSEPERAATIRAALATLAATDPAAAPVVVIHDFETAGYRDAAATRPRGWTATEFDAFLPHTGLVCSGEAAAALPLTAIARTLKRNTATRPSDTAAWRTLHASAR